MARGDGRGVGWHSDGFAFAAIAGALGGILIPMALQRLRADPAVASGTFVTTVTDIAGFFASLWYRDAVVWAEKLMLPVSA